MIKETRERIVLFITVRNSRIFARSSRIMASADGGFIPLYTRFILILADSNLNGIALFFTVDLFNYGRGDGARVRGKRHRYGYYRKSRGPRVKRLSRARRRGQMKRDAYNLPILLLSLHPPGSFTSQHLLCPTCLRSADCNST